jgi:hypothetical protein
VLFLCELGEGFRNPVLRFSVVIEQVVSETLIALSQARLNVVSILG